MTQSPFKRGNKFGAKRTECAHGHKHDSMKEAARCDELHLLQRAGAITNLEQQPLYHFVIEGRPVMVGERKLRFRPDFRYVENGQLTAEDSKGMRTRDYIVRAAFFRACYPDVLLKET